MARMPADSGGYSEQTGMKKPAAGIAQTVAKTNQTT